MLSGAILSKMSAERKIHREYLAITEGTLNDSGRIDAPIARACGSAIERCVDFVHGECAVTHYKSLLHFFAKFRHGQSASLIRKFPYRQKTSP